MHANSCLPTQGSTIIVQINVITVYCVGRTSALISLSWFLTMSLILSGTASVAFWRISSYLVLAYNAITQC